MRSARFISRHPELKAGLCCTVLALAACTAGSPTERWQKPDGRPPDIAETQDCHAQADRLARARYPDQIVRTSPDGTTYHQSNPDRFPAEIRFYVICMRAKGYARGPS
jgi:hypothetical protein